LLPSPRIFGAHYEKARGSGLFRVDGVAIAYLALECAPMADSVKPKRRRFEGFIHQKIDRNLQIALTQLAKLWGVPEAEVPRLAIQNAAMDAALKAEVKTLSKKKSGKRKPSEVNDLKRENERLAAELAESAKKIKAFEKWQNQARQALGNLK
jgi:hypothetical protein